MYYIIFYVNVINDDSGVWYDVLVEPSDTPGQHHARPHIHKQTKSFMKVKIRIILQIF